jgi:hypothetical protein
VAAAVQCPVRTSAVVVAGVFAKCSAEVLFAEDEHAVGDFGAGGENESFGVGVRPWAAGWDLADGDTGVGEDGVEGVGELPGPVTDEDLELLGPVAKIHEQVAGLLGGPRPVRVGGDAEDVHVAAADLEHEEHVQALQRQRAVHVEEVAGEHGGRLGGQEPSPGGVVTPHRCRWNAEAFEDAADRRCADPIAETEQFTLEPLVPPARIGARHLLDQRDDGRVNRWASKPVGVCPVPGHEPAMPAHHRCRSNEPMRPQRAGEEPDQRGERRPVGPVQSWLWFGPAQDRVLVPKHENLDVLGGVAAGKQGQPFGGAAERQVEHAQRHSIDRAVPGQTRLQPPCDQGKLHSGTPQV